MISCIKSFLCDQETAYKQEIALYCKKVEHTGFEPVASTMRMLRAPNCANAPWVSNLQKNYSTDYRKWNIKFGEIAFSFCGKSSIIIINYARVTRVPVQRVNRNEMMGQRETGTRCDREVELWILYTHPMIFTPDTWRFP